MTIIGGMVEALSRGEEEVGAEIEKILCDRERRSVMSMTKSMGEEAIIERTIEEVVVTDIKARIVVIEHHQESIIRTSQHV